MSVKDFEYITPRQFVNKVKGAAKVREADYKNLMEANRMLMFTFVQPHLHKKDRKKTVQQLFPLQWDKDNEQQKNTKKQSIDFWKKVDKK